MICGHYGGLKVHKEPTDGQCLMALKPFRALETRSTAAGRPPGGLHIYSLQAPEVCTQRSSLEQ